MPNWCNNTVEVYHPDPSKLKALVEAFNNGEMCNYIHPVPESLKIVAGRVGDATDPKQIELEAQEKANLEAHGYSTWYDFCVNEWGTKWDVGGDGMEVELKGLKNDATLCFDSAWSPPIGIYEKMLDQGYSVRAYYNEPGMAFAGVWWDGDDNYFDYGGMTSEQIREELPTELDEAMGISESAEMWEEENLEIDLDGGVSAVNEQENENDTK
jgi:hypothetical protein